MCAFGMSRTILYRTKFSEYLVFSTEILSTEYCTKNKKFGSRRTVIFRFGMEQNRNTELVKVKIKIKNLLFEFVV